MMDTLYSKRSQYILGFHGCDSGFAEQVVLGNAMLKQSNHDYDWLGHGIYFWENNAQRAFQWAEENVGRKGSTIKTPGVLGAFLNLGNCLDLTDSENLSRLRVAYDTLKKSLFLSGLPLPSNVDPAHVKSRDRILRKLDCAVIEALHELNKQAGLPKFDSVRGVFWEGEELYPGAGFMQKNHIQIAVINPNCIKGFFLPREMDAKWPNP